MGMHGLLSWGWVNLGTHAWVYSGTSDSGPSEIGTLYNIDLPTKDTARGPKNYFPYRFNTLRTSERGQPLYKGQNS